MGSVTKRENNIPFRTTRGARAKEVHASYEQQCGYAHLKIRDQEKNMNIIVRKIASVGSVKLKGILVVERHLLV